MSIDSAICALAASIISRAHELMVGGYSKSQLNEGFGKVQKFCVHGAMNLAFIEMFPERKEQCGRLFVCGGAAATDIELSPDEAAQLAGMIAMAATQARSMEIE
jgi:hypothetical protein